MPTVLTYTTLVSNLKLWTQKQDETFSNLCPTFIMLGQAAIARDLKTLGFKKSVTGTFTPGASTLAKPSRWHAPVSLNCGTGSSYATQARASSGTVHTLYFTETVSLSASTLGTVSGVSSSTYNGTFTLTSVAANAVTYSSSSLTEAATADDGGTLTTDRDVRNPVLVRSYEFCRAFWPNPQATGLPRYYADYDFSNLLIVPTPAAAYPWELTYYEQPVPLSDTQSTNWLTEYAPDLLLYACLRETAPYLKDDQRVPVWDARYRQILQSEYGQDVVRLNDNAQITGNGGIKA